MSGSFSYHLDSELREVPDNLPAMRTACAALAYLLRSEDLPPPTSCSCSVASGLSTAYWESWTWPKAT